MKTKPTRKDKRRAPKSVLQLPDPRLSFSKTVVVRYRMHLESCHQAQGRSTFGLGPSAG